jgi:hypothetical protein
MAMPAVMLLAHPVLAQEPAKVNFKVFTDQTA